MEKLRIEDVARVCHEANRHYNVAIGVEPGPMWDGVAPDTRKGTEQGVALVLANPGRTPEESHRAWTEHRIGHGWVYGALLDREAKLHPNLVPFDKLPEAEQVKDRLFIAIVEALRPMVQGGW